MTNSNRITTEELANLADPARAGLSQEQFDALLARAQADPASAIELERLRRLMELMRNDTSEDAPTWVINRAVRLFRQRAHAAQQEPSPLEQVIRRIVAVLQFDSAQSPLAYGMRSGVDGTATRQLLFGVNEWMVDVRIGASGSDWQVIGQLLAPDGVESAGTVIRRNETTSVETTLNSMSEFRLPPVTAGEYELTLLLSHEEVVVPMLQVNGGQGTLPLV